MKSQLPNPQRLPISPGKSVVLEDAALLEAISQRRDREAFQQLYERFERPLYNFAYRITGKHQCSEEATQAAWLHIWQYAASFRKEYKVTPWLLRIVVNACLQQMRRKRQDCWIDPELDAAPLSNRENEKAEEPETAECLNHLRVALKSLDPLSCQLVTLHYGAGLPMREISRLLSIPNRTVYHKLGCALATLRTRLTEAGFSATLLLEGGSLLSRSLFEGAAPPFDLAARIRCALDGKQGSDSGKAGRRNPARARSVGCAQAVWTGPLCWALVALAGFAAWSLVPGPVAKAPLSPAPGKAISTSDARVGAGPLPEADLRRRVWTFEAGIPSELANPGGRLVWVPPTGGAPGLAQPKGDWPGMFLVPIWDTDRPFCVRFWWTLSAGSKVTAVGSLYTDGMNLPPSRKWACASKGGSPGSTYFLRNRSLTMAQGEITGYAEFLEMRAFQHVAVFACGASISRIECFELELEQVPKELRNPELLEARPNDLPYKPRRWRTIQEMLELGAPGTLDVADRFGR